MKFSSNKCARIHVGNRKKCDECATIYAHEGEIKSSYKEKYLGDFITKNANSNETIIQRKARGFAILSEMKSLLSEIPLGSRRMEIGLSLRDAWFINGTLYNSETWNSYSSKNVSDLEVIDHMILKLILGAQSKVPVEQLYLETGCLPIPHVISMRRMLYFKNHP